MNEGERKGRSEIAIAVFGSAKPFAGGEPSNALFRTRGNATSNAARSAQNALNCERQLMNYHCGKVDGASKLQDDAIRGPSTSSKSGNNSPRFRGRITTVFDEPYIFSFASKVLVLRSYTLGHARMEVIALTKPFVH